MTVVQGSAWASEEPPLPSLALLPPAPVALRVQPLGGGKMVQWKWLPGSPGKRMLTLEVVGLDTVSEPVGVWTVCVGLPQTGLKLLGPSSSWQEWECHIHDGELDKGTIDDRDRGRYTTYLHQFEVSVTPGPQRHELPSLQLQLKQPGKYHIGLGVERVTPRTIVDFRPHRSTAIVDCFEIQGP